MVEDEPHIRASLISKLSTFEELEIVGEAASISQAFKLISEKRPDSAFIPDYALEKGKSKFWD